MEDRGPSSSSCGVYARAARALHEADYLLILAGAGMSADSGLGTYETMPSRYRDFCDPAKLAAAAAAAAAATTTLPSASRDDHEFQRFWRSFARQYAVATPHEGYRILDAWCHGRKLERLSHPAPPSSVVATTDPTGQENKWWVYTSNVDGHFRRFPSFRCGPRTTTTTAKESTHDAAVGSQQDCSHYYNNVCEIHGCAMEFRCSCDMGYFDRDRVPRVGDLWERWNRLVQSLRPPNRCKVHTETWEELEERAIAESNDNNDNNSSSSSSSSISNTTVTPITDAIQEYPLPNCKECKRLPLRPNVLMFNDTDENVLGPIQTQRQKYQDWEAMVESRVCDSSANANSNANANANNSKAATNFVLLEMGCGTTVPAVRIESEEVLGDTLACLQQAQAQEQQQQEQKCLGDETKGSVTLIRINPKDAFVQDERLLPHVISIPETCLKALQNIDQALDSI